MSRHITFILLAILCPLAALLAGCVETGACVSQDGPRSFCQEDENRSMCNDVDQVFHADAFCSQVGYPHWCDSYDMEQSGAPDGYILPRYLNNASCNPYGSSYGGGTTGGGTTGGTSSGGTTGGNPCSYCRSNQACVAVDGRPECRNKCTIDAECPGTCCVSLTNGEQACAASANSCGGSGTGGTTGGSSSGGTSGGSGSGVCSTCSSSEICVEVEGSGDQCLPSCSSDAQCPGTCCKSVSSTRAACAPSYRGFCGGSGSGSGTGGTTGGSSSGGTSGGGGNQCVNYTKCLQVLDAKRGSGCDGKAVVRVRNTCSHRVDYSFCLSTNDRYGDAHCKAKGLGNWECYSGDVRPGETFKYEACAYTGRYRMLGTRSAADGGDPIGCMDGCATWE